eukprot:1195904-Prorocentrum_minimum.AAC.1
MQLLPLIMLFLFTFWRSDPDPAYSVRALARTKLCELCKLRIRSAYFPPDRMRHVSGPYEPKYEPKVVASLARR